jgi:hypothetical protein
MSLIIIYLACKIQIMKKSEEKRERAHSMENMRSALGASFASALDEKRNRANS